MKKILLILALIVAATGAAVAAKYSTTDVKVLPQAAQTFLKQNFKKGVNHIKVDKKTLGGTEYDVILSDGTEVEFDKNGAWTSIDCGSASVPKSIVPSAITNYVSQNYKGQKITEIDLDRHGYEIQLSSGLELKFDRAGNFIKIDR